MPFWHGDRPGRPLELGRALGAFVRELRELPPVAGDRACSRRLRARRFAAANLLQYVAEQAEATGVVPDDRTIVDRAVPGRDRRLAGLHPDAVRHAGARPWAMAIERRLTERFDLPVESMWGDDGIVLRLPEAADELPLEAVMIDPEDIEEMVVGDAAADGAVLVAVPGVRRAALLLPRRRPDQRTPLWQQRQKAADCWPWRRAYPTFPILLETSRECLQDVFDVPALREVLSQLRAARCASSPSTRPSRARWRRACCSTGSPPTCTRATPRSPSAGPRRWRSTVTCCATCSAPRSCASCSIPACSPTSSSTCSGCRTAGGRAAPTSCTTCCAGSATSRSPSSTAHESTARCCRRCPSRAGRPAAGWLAELLAEKRAIEVVVAGEARVRRRRRRRPLPRRARLRAAARAAGGVHRPGAAPARGPRRPLRPHARAVHRARGRGRLGVARAAHRSARSAALEAAERVVRGEFRPEGVRREWCDADVLRQLRRRSLATLRREVEPVEPEALARFLPAWHGIPPQRRGVDAVVEALGLLAGAPIVASTLESDVLAARVADYRPASSTSCARRATWCGSAPARSARPTVGCGSCFADQLALLAPGWEAQDRPDGALHEAIRARLAERGRQLLEPGPGGRARRRPTTSCSPRCGTSCGRARSRTTRSPRCGRSRGPPAVARRAARWRPRPAAGRARAASTASDRRPGKVAGASSRRCSIRRRRRRRRRTPRRCNSSSATACSPARPCSPRVSSVAMPRCTACSRCSRSVGRSGVATSSVGSAPPSSPSPARSTGCAWHANGPTRRSAATVPSPRPWCWRPPTRPSPTARRWRGRSPPVARRGRARPSWCCATASRSPGTTGGRTTSSRSRTRTTTARGPRRSPISCGRPGAPRRGAQGRRRAAPDLAGQRRDRRGGEGCRLDRRLQGPPVHRSPLTGATGQVENLGQAQRELEHGLAGSGEERTPAATE